MAARPAFAFTVVYGLVSSDSVGQRGLSVVLGPCEEPMVTAPAHGSIRARMDEQITASVRPATAPELVEIDRRMGGLKVNRRTYRLIRFVRRFVQAPRDLAGVTVVSEPALGAKGAIVKPHDVRSAGALYLIHGGGFVVGSPTDVLGAGAALARALGVKVLLPTYRRAPQSPFPAGLDDCHGGWRFVHQHADRLGIDPAKIVLGGWSAGGGHAAALAQRLLDEGGPQPAAQLLVYPMLDDATAEDTERDALGHRVWNNASNRFGWSSYLGKVGRAEPPAYAVPARRAHLAGLPPVWIGVGTPDLFLHEDRAYALRLEAAGVPCTYVEVEGAIHGFDLLVPGCSLSQSFLTSMVEFARPFVV